LAKTGSTLRDLSGHGIAFHLPMGRGWLDLPHPHLFRQVRTLLGERVAPGHGPGVDASKARLRRLSRAGLLGSGDTLFPDRLKRAIFLAGLFFGRPAPLFVGLGGDPFALRLPGWRPWGVRGGNGIRDFLS
jgi:hypothetical protein